MVDVKVTAAVGTRTVRLEDISDSRVRAGLQSAVTQVATRLATVKCPTHKKGPTDVRIHFDRNGAADLKYDSCCPLLAEAIGRALG
jgi:hypothetical protein